MMFFV